MPKDTNPSVKAIFYTFKNGSEQKSIATEGLILFDFCLIALRHQTNIRASVKKRREGKSHSLGGIDGRRLLPEQFATYDDLKFSVKRNWNII